MGFLSQGPNLVPDLREVRLFHAFYEKDAVEVVDFVLDTTGEQAVAFEDVRYAVEILIFHPDEFGARDVSLDPGQGQATFLVVELIARKKLDLRVGQGHGFDKGRGEGFAVQDAGHRVIGMIGNLDHAKAQGFPDLLSRQTDALGVAHGVDHVTGQVDEFVGKVGDRLAFFVKDAFSVLCDAKGHMGEERPLLEFGSGKPRTPNALIEVLPDVNKNRLQNRGG